MVTAASGQGRAATKRPRETQEPRGPAPVPVNGYVNGLSGGTWVQVHGHAAIFTFRSLDHYSSWQSTSTLLVSPLVTVTGPEASQSAVPSSYCGLCPETVYVPTDAGTENRPFAPTEMIALLPFDPWRVTCPLKARGPTPEGPPTAWSVPVRVPAGPGGPLGDEQLASNTEAAMTGSRESKVRELRRTAHPPVARSWTTCSNEPAWAAQPAVTATRLWGHLPPSCCRHPMPLAWLTWCFKPRDGGPARRSLR